MLHVTYERVKDYWGKDLPVNVGRKNFDRRRYVYIQDENAEWQAKREQLGLGG